MIRDQLALHEVHPEAEFEADPASELTKIGRFIQTDRPASGSVADRHGRLAASDFDRSTWTEFSVVKAAGESV
jgi:hypothetical protein